MFGSTWGLGWSGDSPDARDEDGRSGELQARAALDEDSDLIRSNYSNGSDSGNTD